MTQADRGYDFDVHGFVGLRLVNPSEADLRAVQRQLGLIPCELRRAPDITIQFVDRLSTGSGMRLLGAGEAAFTDDAFLVLQCKHESVQVQIPFDELGGPCEIVCRTGLPAVPWLIATINLTALAKGVCPLHASATRFRETGLVMTGWSKGGKTETLLALLAQGAEYIGDEWIYLSRDGERVYGLPEPVRIWNWHVRQLPFLQSRIGRRARRGLRTLELMRLGCRWLRDAAPRRLRVRNLINKTLGVLNRQVCVDVPPAQLCPDQRIPASTSFDQLLFVVSTDSPRITVEPADPLQIARRMAFSLAYERQAFQAFYQMFRFAFPDRSNPLLESAAELERELLARALADKPAHVLSHPYPVCLSDLARAVESLVPAIPPDASPTPAHRGAPTAAHVLEASNA